MVRCGRRGATWLVACGLSLALWTCGGSPSQMLPAVDGEEVQPARVLPQGQGDVTVVITRRAGGLASPTSVDLGGLMVVVQAASTDHRLVLSVAVPHGLPLGGKTLTVVTGAGTVSVPVLVEVTPLAVAPTGSDAQAIVGSTAQPFRTLKRALAAAGAGDTVRLQDGDYDSAAGESWNYALPARLTIEGQSTAGTRLVGPAVAGGAPVTADGLIAAPDVVLRRLTVAAMNRAVRLPVSGALTLEDVRLSDNQGDALSIDEAAAGATVAVTGNAWAIGGGGGDAIAVAAAGASITVKGGTIESGGDGISLRATCLGCRLDITGTTITSSDDSTRNYHAVVVSGQGKLGTTITARGGTFHGGFFIDDGSGALMMEGGSIAETRVNNGIYFRGTDLQVTGTSISVMTSSYGVELETGNMVLSGVTIDGGTYGIYHSGGVAKLRGTTIKGFTFVGYYLSTGDLDLGTRDETGGNAFVGPSTGYGLYIARLGQANPVTCSNTTFNGETPPPGDVTGAFDQPPKLFINVGEVVSFSVR